MTVATGFPFDISHAGATSRSLYCDASLSFYACPDETLQTGPLVRSNPRARLASKGNGVWFQNVNFAAEPIGSFGNIHRNPYHGPGVNNTNAILAKNFILSQDGLIHLQLRMESDNVFNHTQFSHPTSSFTSGSFGQISSAAAARQTRSLPKSTSNQLLLTAHQRKGSRRLRPRQRGKKGHPSGCPFCMPPSQPGNTKLQTWYEYS
jgi:hypothetical protein